MTDTTVKMVKVNRTVAAIADPIVAVMLSAGEIMGGVVDEMVGAGVTIADPGARVDSFAPGVSLDLDPESSERVVAIAEGKSITRKGLLVVIVLLIN